MTEAPPPPSDLSSEAAFREICQSGALAIDAALALFLETEDPAGPHRARVALRRLTTALDAFAPILRRRATAELRAVAKRIFRDLGQVRDSDVYLQARRGTKGKTVPAALAARNRDLRESLRRKLRRDRAVGFAQRIRAAVQPDGGIFRRSASARRARLAPVRGLGGDALDKAWRRCLAYGPSVGAIPVDDLHDFRKDMKALRYLAEFFAPHFPGLQAEPFRSDFRDIQDALGILNDYAVALKIEGKPGPATLPPPQASAMARAQQLWAGLAGAMPPWSAGHERGV